MVLYLDDKLLFCELTQDLSHNLAHTLQGLDKYTVIIKASHYLSDKIKLYI
jgi:hypothetical protein